MSGQSGGRIRLSKLNEQLTCKLCGGYFIDATTIIECLHSFCRSCIVKYLETNKYCPICEVQVHKSKPLLNIRPDHTLQDIVYKLVPGCYQNEMRCRREFYEKHPEAQLASMSPEARGEPIESHIYSPDESLSLSLEYYNPNFNETPVVPILDDTKESSIGNASTPLLTPIKIQPRRYLRCPAAVTVFHLQKLIRAKYGLSDAHRVDVMYKEESLIGNYTLMDVMYIYHWRRKVPLHLSYRIFESSPKRMKLADDNTQFKESCTTAGISSIEPKDETTKREWKEVQLKISETGVMSVTGIHTSPDAKKAKLETLEDEQRRLDESVAAVKSDKKEKINESDLSKDSEKSECDTKKSKSEAKLTTNNNNSSSNFNSTMEAAGLRVDTTTAPTPTPTTTATPTTREKHKVNESKNSQSAGGSGSKIDALSAKLQFQPKVGPVNNTYAKKTPKDKKILEKTLKKTEARNAVDGPKEGKIVEKNRLTVTAKSSAKNTNSSADTATMSTVTATVTTPSVSISLTRRNSSPERGKDTAAGSVKRRPSSGDTENTNQRPATSGATTPARSNSGAFTRQNNLVPSNENLANIGLNVSTAILGLGPSGSPSSSSSSSTFPYTVQDLVNNAMKSPTKSSSQKQSTASGTGAQFTLQTPSMSVYSIPNTTKNTSNSVTTANSGKSKNNLDSTTVYSVPPCPDAIPISLMKPTIRKTEMIAKGTNLNDICAKIGTSGSKINDICAKIGENSKEKNKTETRSRPEIPDLLKITKKTISTNDITTKHIPNIPNVPIYTPSNSLTESKNKLSITTSSTNPSTTVSTTSSTTSSSSSSTGPQIISSTSVSFQLTTGRPGNQLKKSQSQSVGYKTLRDPPKSWNPTLSKNNYVAAKNQAKEMQNQTQTQVTVESTASSGTGGSGGTSKTITSKPAKIFKMRNMPRYLGNPASGVKPMYGENNEGKDGNKESTATKSTSNVAPSMTKIDPKTLSPIVSTNTNSPIVSPPPYSPNARSYQNTPFSRTTSSPMSPRNSPVNMLSTNPFIPSPKPNTNPRLFYSPFPPFDTNRFPNPLIRSPIGMTPPSAFHSSLPPSINKIYHQRTSYMPQTTSATYSQQGLTSQTPTVQRILPSTHSSPKSPKNTVTSSTFNLAKTETQTSIPTSLDGGKTSTNQETNAFNLSKTGGSNYASDLSKSSNNSGDKVMSTATTSQTSEKSIDEKEHDERRDDDSNDDKKIKSDKDKKKRQPRESDDTDKDVVVTSKNGNDTEKIVEKNDETSKTSENSTKINGSPPSIVNETKESERSDEKTSIDKPKDSRTDGKNLTENDDKDSALKEDSLKSGEHIQNKKEIQRNKAES